MVFASVGSLLVIQCQSWAAGIETLVPMRSTPDTITLVAPSHRETLPLARITWFSSDLRHRAKTFG